MYGKTAHLHWVDAIPPHRTALPPPVQTALLDSTRSLLLGMVSRAQQVLHGQAGQDIAATAGILAGSIFKLQGKIQKLGLQATQDGFTTIANAPTADDAEQTSRATAAFLSSPDVIQLLTDAPG